MIPLYYRLLTLGLLLAKAGLAWGQVNLVIDKPQSTTPGALNTLIGVGAGNAQMSAIKNVFLGRNTGHNTTVGGHNVYIGNAAGYSGVGETAFSNVMIGDSAGYKAYYGLNVFIGAESGTETTTGCCNTFTGYQSGLHNTVGKGNTYTGWVAGFNSYGGLYNSYYGYQAGSDGIGGNYNTALGSFAGTGGGNLNVIMGYFAHGWDAGGDENVIIGDSAGYRNVASGNVILGGRSGLYNTTGAQNTYLGYQSGYHALADSNTFVGYQSGYRTTTGKGNTFFGTASGRGNSSGNHNTFIGNRTGSASGTGDDNVYMGYNTGQYDSGSRNTYVGTRADAIAPNLINATAIGAGAQVAVSNAVVLGDGANVGIGTSTPTTRLDINSGLDHESGVRFSRLTANSPTHLRSAEKLLTVDGMGNLILTPAGHYVVRSVSDWSDKVFMRGYRLRSFAALEQFIQKHQHLPGVPSATEVVEQGLYAARMDATLLEKIEELTLYSIQLDKDRQQQKVINQQQQVELDELKRLLKQLLKKQATSIH